MLLKNTLKIVSMLLVLVFMIQSAAAPYQDIKYSFKHILPRINYLSPLLLSPDLLLSIFKPVMEAYADPVADGKDFGKNQLNIYHPDNINSTLQQTCVQKDSQGNCTKYMVNEQSGMFTNPGQIIPNMQETAEQSGNYSGYANDLTASQVQGQASTTYSDFMATGIHNNECYERDAQGVCTKTKLDMINDIVFGSRCLQKGSDGKCITWGKSRDIMENSYADCVKKITPIYEKPGTMEVCEVDPKNMFKTEEKSPCTVQNNPRLHNEVVFTKCEGAVSYRNGQIYGVCKDWYFWHLVFDRTVSWTPANANECPTSCEQLGGLCNNFPAGHLTTPPSGGEYLGEYYDSFIAEPGNPPATPPSCSYSAYKWYRQYDHSTVERIFLDRTSNCDSAKLDEWIEECRIKKYEICSAGGGGCVTVINDENPTGATNKICRNITGTMRNYVFCPNSGGASSGSDTLQDEPILIDDGTGEKEITKIQRNETLKEFAETVIWSMSYGGEGVKGAVNDYYAVVTFTCDTHTETPPECQGLIDQGCKFKDFKCIDPPANPSSNVIPECLIYEYTYQCGLGGKVLGYQVDYECATGLVEGLKCLGTECADGYYDANHDFMMFATATEILKQIQIDTDTSNLDNIRIFPGEHRECQSFPNNCCKKLQGGISIADYVQLGFNLAIMYQFVTLGYTAMSASLGASISGVFGGSVTNYAIYGATNLFPTSSTLIVDLSISYGGTFSSLGAVQTSVLPTGQTLVTSTTCNSLVSSVASIMTAVSIIMLVYSIVSFIYEMLFGCNDNDQATGIQLGQSRCHYTGSRCSKKILGICIKKKKVHCCFSSLLARLIHEQGRPQIGKSWGTPKSPDCSGFTPDELSQLDFGSMDLTEYMQYLEGKYTEQLTEQQQVDYQSGAQGNLPTTQQTIRDKLEQYYKPK